MDKELEQLKSVLRSLVVSSSTQVDVRTLAYEYRTLLGGPMPIAKYGYKTIIEFLRERCQDCFILQGSSNNPVLTLIVPEKLQHIDKFVQRQKVTAAVKQKGKRRSVPAPTTATTPSRKPNTNYHNPRSEPSIGTRFTTTTNSNLNGDQVVSNTNIVKKYNYNSNRETPHITEPTLPKSNDDAADIIRDQDSGRMTSSSGSSSASRLFECLKDDIRELLEIHSKGIWSVDLMDYYQASYGRDLPLSRTRHTSVVSLCSVMSEVVTIHRPDPEGDWLLLPPHAPPPKPKAQPAVPRPLPSFVQKQSALTDPDDALPGVPYDPSVFPSDCVGELECIPAIGVKDLRVGQFVDVMVGEVYSPSHFWCIRLGTQHHLAMESIMDRMDEYYIRGEGKSRKLSAGAVRVGQYCAAEYEGFWHRSVIVKIVDRDTVKVRHIDYGTVSRVTTTSLRPLRRQWASLPAQAVRCRLAGLGPARRMRRWLFSASEAFLNLVKERRLVAHILNVDDDELHVRLVDTTDQHDVCINKELVNTGHAEFSLQTAELYRLPGWDALEGGLTPQYGELCEYAAAGLDPLSISSYMRHVPPADTLPSSLHDDLAELAQKHNGPYTAHSHLQINYEPCTVRDDRHNDNDPHINDDSYAHDQTLTVPYSETSSNNTLSEMFEAVSLEAQTNEQAYEIETRDKICVSDSTLTSMEDKHESDKNSLLKFIAYPFASIPCFIPGQMMATHTSNASVSEEATTTVTINQSHPASAMNKFPDDLSQSECKLPQACELSNNIQEATSLPGLLIKASRKTKLKLKNSLDTTLKQEQAASVSTQCSSSEFVGSLVEIKCPVSTQSTNTTGSSSFPDNSTQTESQRVVSSHSDDSATHVLTVDSTQPSTSSQTDLHLSMAVVPYTPLPSACQFSPNMRPQPAHTPPGFPNRLSQQENSFCPNMPPQKSKIPMPPSGHPCVGTPPPRPYLSSQTYPGVGTPPAQPNAGPFPPPSHPFMGMPSHHYPHMGPPPAQYNPGPRATSPAMYCVSLSDVDVYLRTWATSPIAAASYLQMVLQRGPGPGPTISLTPLGVRIYFTLLKVDPIAAHEHISVVMCSAATLPPPGFH